MEERLALYDMALNPKENAVLIQIQATKEIDLAEWKNLLNSIARTFHLCYLHQKMK